MISRLPVGIVIRRKDRWSAPVRLGQIATMFEGKWAASRCSFVATEGTLAVYLRGADRHVRDAGKRTHQALAKMQLYSLVFPTLRLIWPHWNGFGASQGDIGLRMHSRGRISIVSGGYRSTTTGGDTTSEKGDAQMRGPRRSELNALAKPWGFSFSEDELDEIYGLTEWLATLAERIELAPDVDAVPPVGGARSAGQPPSRGEDPYNAIIRWCQVRGDAAEDAPLTGIRVAIKDSIAVAGIPLTCGSSVLRDFVPTRDSTVISRLLEAGAEIRAIANMDSFGFSGGGDTSAYGYIRNPFDKTRTAGGSSGGSAAALYYDHIDVSLGCDQGGSIRVPAAWCGVLGIKPTYGLVPYTGIVGMDASYDHCGPMARTVLDLARVLEVIAGYDPDDPRQTQDVRTDRYIERVVSGAKGIRDLSVGALTEGFDEGSEEARRVCEVVRGVISQLAELGCKTTDISVPGHRLAGPVAVVSHVEGMTASFLGGGNGYHRRGHYWPEQAIAMKSALTAFGPELSPSVKVGLVFGSHLQRSYLGATYAKAQNLRSVIRRSYDAALDQVDLLVMPTVPNLPHKNQPEMSTADLVARGWAVARNTAPTDMTGHPAITIPAGELDGLPVGVMLVGRHFDEGTLLSLASAYERRFGWSPAPHRQRN